MVRVSRPIDRGAPGIVGIRFAPPIQNGLKGIAWPRHMHETWDTLK